MESNIYTSVVYTGKIYKNNKFYFLQKQDDSLPNSINVKHFEQSKNKVEVVFDINEDEYSLGMKQFSEHYA